MAKIQEIKKRLFTAHVISLCPDANDFNRGFVGGVAETAKLAGVSRREVWDIFSAADDWVEAGNCPAHKPEHRKCVLGCDACMKAAPSIIAAVDERNKGG